MGVVTPRREISVLSCLDSVAVEDSVAVRSHVKDSKALGGQAVDSVAAESQVEASEAVEDSEAVGSQAEDSVAVGSQVEGG